MIKVSYGPIPENCFLLDTSKYDKERVRNGRQTWVNKKRDRYYQWDDIHDHVEEYTKRRKHYMVKNTLTGERISGADKTKCPLD